MRTQGSLRVVLNTKIWAAMTVERASQKSIRITAVDSDDGSVRVYLIMVSWIVMFTLHEYKWSDRNVKVSNILIFFPIFLKQFYLSEKNYVLD